MKSGWILSVTDLHTRNQASKLFLESREKTSKRIMDVKNRYDAVIKDRFKVIIQSPYWETNELEQTKYRIKRSGKNLEEILLKLSEVDPLCLSETTEEFLFEIPTKYSEQTTKLLEDTSYIVVV